MKSNPRESFKRKETRVTNNGMGHPVLGNLPPELRPGGAWNSRLVPYQQDIYEWRKERKPYREIVNLLNARGVEISLGMVQKFVAARSRRRVVEMLPVIAKTAVVPISEASVESIVSIPGEITKSRNPLPPTKNMDSTDEAIRRLRTAAPTPVVEDPLWNDLDPSQVEREHAEVLATRAAKKLL